VDELYDCVRAVIEVPFQAMHLALRVAAIRLRDVEILAFDERPHGVASMPAEAC
jgi:hypothetical protein